MRRGVLPGRRLRRRAPSRRFTISTLAIVLVLLCLWFRLVILTEDERTPIPAPVPHGNRHRQGAGVVGVTRSSSPPPAASTTVPASTAAPTIRTGASPYAAVDDMDVLPPRDGETRIPFATYLECLARTLHLDLVNRRELPLPAPPTHALNKTAASATGPTTIGGAEAEPHRVVIPYLIQPVSIELADAKQFLCGLRAPVRQLTYVMNGNAPEVRVFLEAVEQAVGAWTSRVRVVYIPEGAGSAGAINVGLRHALSSFTYDEVPFVLIAQPNVRIPAATMADFLPMIYDFTSFDKEKIDHLAKEVAAEEAEEARKGRPPRHTPLEGAPVAGAGDGALLSTSLLLPQRIRDLPLELQMEAFIEHFAFFFFNTDEGPGDMTAFAVTRLAVLVGGLWDENYYPDYFDDPDIRWRYRQLGFSSYRASIDVPPVVFYEDPFLAKDPAPTEAAGAQAVDLPVDGAAQTARARLSPEARAFREQVVDAFADGHSFAYAAWKWGVSTPRELQVDFGHRPAYSALNRAHGFAKGKGGVPVDAWVLDGRRRRALRQVLAKQRLADRRPLLFDTSLFEKTVFLAGRPTPPSA